MVLVVVGTHCKCLIETLHAQIQKCFARGGGVGGRSNSDVVCFFYEGKEDPNSTKSGPSSARQQNAI